MTIRGLLANAMSFENMVYYISKKLDKTMDLNIEETNLVDLLTINSFRKKRTQILQYV